MDQMFLVEVIATLCICLFFGTIVYRGKKRLGMARDRLKYVRVEKNLDRTFEKSLMKAGQKAYSFYSLAVVLFIVGAIVGFQIYASIVEPRAVVLSWIILTATAYGLPLLGGIIVVSLTVATAWQTFRANQLLATYIKKYPTATVLRDAKSFIAPRIGEEGVSVLSFIAVVGSLLAGAGIIALLFITTQTAIACARSSKCL